MIVQAISLWRQQSGSPVQVTRGATDTFPHTLSAKPHAINIGMPGSQPGCRAIRIRFAAGAGEKQAMRGRDVVHFPKIHALAQDSMRDTQNSGISSLLLAGRALLLLTGMLPLLAAGEDFGQCAAIAPDAERLAWSVTSGSGLA